MPVEEAIVIDVRSSETASGERDQAGKRNLVKDIIENTTNTGNADKKASSGSSHVACLDDDDDVDVIAKMNDGESSDETDMDNDTQSLSPMVMMPTEEVASSAEETKRVSKRKQSAPTKGPEKAATETTVAGLRGGARTRVTFAPKIHGKSRKKIARAKPVLTTPKRRFKQGTVILREMRRQQKMAHVKKCIPRERLKIILQEAAQSITKDGGLRIQSSAVDCIHEAAEDFLIRMYQASSIVMVNMRNRKLMINHWNTVKDLPPVPELARMKTSKQNGQ